MISRRDSLALSFKCLAYAIVVASCLIGCWEIVGRMVRPSVAPHIAEWRKAARFLPEDGAAMLCRKGEGLSPVERSRLITLAWEMLPHAVKNVTLEQVDSSVYGLATSAFLPNSVQMELQAKGLRKKAEIGNVAIWLRDGVSFGKPSSIVDVHPMREAIGTGFVLLLMGVFYIWMSHDLVHPARNVTFLSAALFVALSEVALAHSLLPPNGLGVYGGKARLLYLSGCIPSDFWTNSECSIFQPSYPPGLTILTLLAYLFAGGCGDWLVQLIPVWSLVLLFTVLAGTTRNWFGLLVAFGLVSAPISVKMATEFYAEPLAAICLVCGWRCVCRRIGFIGWLIAGFAGLFRHEGLVAAMLLWLSVRLALGDRHAQLRHFAVMLILSVSWQIFVLVNGASVFDFDFTSLPEWRQVFSGLIRGMDACTVHFWQTGGSWLGAACACGYCFLNRGNSGDKNRIAAILFGVLMLITACLLIGCYRGQYFGWILDTVLPRLVWVASVLVTASVSDDSMCNTNARLS